MCSGATAGMGLLDGYFRATTHFQGLGFLHGYRGNLGLRFLKGLLEVESVLIRVARVTAGICKQAVWSYRRRGRRIWGLGSTETPVTHGF